MATDSAFADWRTRCEQALERALPPATQAPADLHAAMRYAVLGGGKRVRPLLVYAAGTACGAELEWLDAPAAAVELIHAYSLVHDDLPAMDNDTLRRGRPTVHVAFGEARAILVGDALQSLAFDMLANAPLPDSLRVALLQTLSAASGSLGMAGGQAIDLAATGNRLDADALASMHRHKTGALIRAAVRMGALTAQASAAHLEILDEYADALGLAFQIRDDILDVEGDSGTMGKSNGKDARQGKPTYVSALGLQGARTALTEQNQRLRRAWANLGGKVEALEALGEMAVARRA